MRITFLVYLATLTSLNCFAASNEIKYITTCIIANDKATGVLHNISLMQAIIYKGPISFDFFDKDDQLIDRKIKENIFGVVMAQTTKDIDQLPVSAGASRCVFKMTKAIPKKSATGLSQKDVSEVKETQKAD